MRIYWDGGVRFPSVFPKVHPFRGHGRRLPSVVRSAWALCPTRHSPLRPTAMPSGRLPSEVTPTLSSATPAPLPALVEDDVSTAPSVAISVPPTTSCASPPAVVDSSPLPAALLDLSAISTRLWSLSDAVHRLTDFTTPPVPASSVPASLAPPSLDHVGGDTDASSTRLLLTMSPDEIQ